MQRILLLIWIMTSWAGAVAWAQTPITVTQGSFSTELIPLNGDVSAAAFYGYRNDQANANLGFEKAGHSLLFFYRERPSDALSFVVLHGPPALDVTNSTGIARFTFTGLPATSTLDVRDDSQDTYEFKPPVARIRWKWHTGRTDGSVIGQLGSDFEIKLAPHFIQGVKQWNLVTLGSDGPVLVPLPRMDQPLTMTIGAAAGRGTRASFTISPTPPYYAFTTIYFDASASLAPEGGEITQYEWDFDGDGIFEAQTTRAVVSQVFTHAGPTSVTLRVLTSGGTRATTTQILNLLVLDGLDGMREISTSSAKPGSTFRVTLSLAFDHTFAGVGVEEIWPAGWTITAVQNDGAVLKAERGQWVFASTLTLGERRTLIYDVTVPPAGKLGALPYAVHVEGTLSASLPQMGTPISGESVVEIASCLPTPVALAHYDIARAVVDLRLPESITSMQLAFAELLWLEGGTEGIPMACSPAITLDDLQYVLGHYTLGISVDQPLPYVGVERSVHVVRHIYTKLPERQMMPSLPNGNLMIVKLEVIALRDLTSIGVMEVIPFGWDVIYEGRPDVRYNPRATQWLFLGPILTGQTRTLEYEVVVPRSQAAGVFPIAGMAFVPDSLFSEIIEGDQDVTVLVCLPLLLAIAHLNTEDGSADMGLDNVIYPHQSQAANDLWLNNTPVPGTCGQVLDYDTVMLVIQYAMEGIPVGQPLPGTPSPEEETLSPEGEGPSTDDDEASPGADDTADDEAP